jgi:predicted MFS family arabinose efflux permease
MDQHAQSIYDYPGTLSTRFYSYLIAHDGLAQVLMLSGVAIQASFIGGFFTRKYDRVYLFLFIAFFVVNFILMHILSLELFILLIVLLDWDKIDHKTSERAIADAAA